MLAFLAGWLLRGVAGSAGTARRRGDARLAAGRDDRRVDRRSWPGSCAAYPGELAGVVDQIVHVYFFVGDRIGVVDGARLLEGIGLAAATVDAVPPAPVAGE